MPEAYFASAMRVELDLGGVIQSFNAGKQRKLRKRYVFSSFCNRMRRPRLQCVPLMCRAFQNYGQIQFKNLLGTFGFASKIGAMNLHQVIVLNL